MIGNLYSIISVSIPRDQSKRLSLVCDNGGPPKAQPAFSKAVAVYLTIFVESAGESSGLALSALVIPGGHDISIPVYNIVIVVKKIPQRNPFVTNFPIDFPVPIFIIDV